MSGTWVNTVVRHIRALADGRNAADQTDERLLEQFVAHRDESAFAALLKRHGPMTMGVCLRVVQDKHLAEDAFQATFLVLALKADAIRKRGSVASWLHGVASRLARKLKAETCRSQQPIEHKDCQPLRDTPMEASWREERQLLDEELGRLPDKYRLPLLLCYFEGRTQEEAAAELGFTPGKVKGLLDRGRERLRFRLLRRGVTLSTAAAATLWSDAVLSAAVPPLLAASTIEAAVNLVSGQTLALCGVSATVANLTKGGLIMGAKKLMLILASILLTGSLAVGAALWTKAGKDAAPKGQSPVAVANVPVPKEKDGDKAEGKLSVMQQTSQSVHKEDLEFQLVSSVIWPMPAPTRGGSHVQFQLLVANCGKNAVRFLPIGGKPFLQTEGGKELPMHEVGRNHLRALPEPMSLEAGKSVTIKCSAGLGRNVKSPNLSWEDETGMVWSIDDVTAGKYLLSLQYQSMGHKGSWVGEVRTKTVPLEIVDLKASEPAVTKGLEVIALADGTWQAPHANDKAGKRVCLGFRIMSVDKPKHYPWVIPSIGSVSIKSADGAELPLKKTTRAVAVPEPQLMVLEPNQSRTVATAARLFSAGKTLTLAWADGAGNVWHVENLKPGKYTVRYVIQAGKGGQDRPVTWIGELSTAALAVEVLAPAKEDAQKKAIDAATMAAYEKLGATFGWLVQSELVFAFVDGMVSAEYGVLPAFSFKNAPPAKLPDVNIPFGLLFHAGAMTNAGLNELVGLKNLTHLGLRKTSVTDAGVKELADCEHLASLDLRQTEVTDAGIKELARFHNLTALHLDETQITDAGLKHLARLANLSALTLGGTRVTDAGLKELAGLKRLKTFSVNFTNVTDAGLKELAGCEGLTSLGLATKHIGDAGLKELAGLKNVTTMFLGNTQVTDAGIKHLAGYRNLSWLILGGTRVTDTGLMDLARHKKLNWLSLSDTHVTDAGLKELAGLIELTELFLDGTKVTDAGLQELSSLTKLRSLFLHRTTVTDAGAARLRQSLPKCQVIIR